MDVLISEDDDYKYEKIEKAIRNSLPKCTIHRETCIRDTIEYLRNNNIDVLIQDMNLPVWKNSNIRYAGGIDVVYTVGIEDIPIKFRFVCSSDETFKDEFGEDFDGFGFKFVHFEASRTLDNAFSFKEQTMLNRRTNINPIESIDLDGLSIEEAIEKLTDLQKNLQTNDLCVKQDDIMFYMEPKIDVDLQWGGNIEVSLIQKVYTETEQDYQKRHAKWKEDEKERLKLKLGSLEEFP